MTFGNTDINMWFVFPQALGFAIFFVAAMAELNRPPFDMPIADSELVFGFMTEYTGIKFAMFLLTEYAGMVSMSALMVVLYLGGWQILPGVPLPGCDGAAGIFDCGFSGRHRPRRHPGQDHGLVFVMVWARVAYPRLREDQLQRCRGWSSSRCPSSTSPSSRSGRWPCEPDHHPVEGRPFGRPAC
jgi:NADH-quinone oxidoreductase subunit H